MRLDLTRGAEKMKENITAVCISGKEEAWHVPEIPFYCHTTGFKEFPHYPPVKTRNEYNIFRRAGTRPT